jgi:hypothetical protein
MAQRSLRHCHSTAFITTLSWHSVPYNTVSWHSVHYDTVIAQRSLRHCVMAQRSLRHCHSTAFITTLSWHSVPYNTVSWHGVPYNTVMAQRSLQHCHSTAFITTMYHSTAFITTMYHSTAFITTLSRHSVHYDTAMAQRSLRHCVNVQRSLRHCVNVQRYNMVLAYFPGTGDYHETGTAANCRLEFECLQWLWNYSTLTAEPSISMLYNLVKLPSFVYVISDMFRPMLGHHQGNNSYITWPLLLA